MNDKNSKRWKVIGTIYAPEGRYLVHVEIPSDGRYLTSAQARELAAELVQMADWIDAMNARDPNKEK